MPGSPHGSAALHVHAWMGTSLVAGLMPGCNMPDYD